MPATVAPPSKPWYLYILGNAKGLLYVGITVDLARRIAQHNGKTKKGARFTRGRGPWYILYVEHIGPGVSQALRRERQVKRFHKPQKLRLCGY